MSKNEQIKSRNRVVDHGEVFTSDREVDGMLNLIPQESDRIESRFLEPACGTGNFLIKIYERKLKNVEARYKKSQLEYERYAFIATCSIYGVDILEDNVIECQNRLLDFFKDNYSRLYKKKIKTEFLDTIKFVLSKNILLGDALTMMKPDGNLIEFSEWNFVKGSQVKRRDYVFSELIPEEDNIFAEKNDKNKSVFIPNPIREYPLTHYIKVVEYE